MDIFCGFPTTAFNIARMFYESGEFSYVKYVRVAYATLNMEGQVRESWEYVDCNAMFLSLRSTYFPT